jgi:hypothetical protein
MMWHLKPGLRTIQSEPTVLLSISPEQGLTVAGATDVTAGRMATEGSKTVGFEGDDKSD